MSNNQTKKAWYQNPLGLIVVAIIAAAVGAYVVSSMSSNKDDAASSEVSVDALTADNAFKGSEIGTVTITGDKLEPLTSPGNDPAVGAFAPDFVATSLKDDSEVIVDAGKARVLVFAAHWCGFCQSELPAIKGWLEANELPANTEVVVVSSSANKERGNYPPTKWFSTLDWPTTVVADDKNRSILTAYGIAGFPTVVGVHADGSVAVRGASFADTVAALES